MTVAIDNKINDLVKKNASSEAEGVAPFALCLKTYLDQFGWGNQSYDVLRALVELTTKHYKRGNESVHFTAQNIFAAANIAIPDGKNAAAKLSPLWKKLIEEILPTREKGIQDFARNHGLSFYLWPEKDKSEGGRPSEYFLTLRPVPSADIASVEVLGPGEIAYIRELTPEPSWWAKSILKNGYRLVGWRRWAFLGYGVGSIVASALALLLLWGLFWFMPTWSIKELVMVVFASVFLIFASWLTLGPLFRLLEWRIVMAPASVVALNELNVQMEIVRDSHLEPDSPGTIRLVRYASTCPQCHAKIEVVEGGKEFRNRLVGRCRENPGEHVYSFDRFSCRGRSMRNI